METRRFAARSGPGHIHWSIKAIKEDRGGLRAKLRSVYSESAIPPATPWLGSSAPEPVYVAPIENGQGVQLLFKPSTTARWRIIQVKEGNSWVTLRRIPASQESIQLDSKPSVIAIRHIGPTGILSIPTVLANQ